MLLLLRGGAAVFLAFALRAGLDGGRVDVCVVVVWRKRMWEDGVPDYGFGWGCAGGGRGVGGRYVEEDLFGVPGEEGGEV